MSICCVQNSLFIKLLTNYLHTVRESAIWESARNTNSRKTCDIDGYCAYIRSVVAELYGQETADKVRIPYGGSVKPEGLKTLLEQPDIDGALVGGASLLEDSYKAMIANLG